MKKIILLILFLSILQGFAHGQPGNIRFSPQVDTLYPPTSLDARPVETVIFLEWEKPVTSEGITPPGLLGYYVYRNGVRTYYINDPDRLFAYEYDLDPGWYLFKATAYYDLTPYGHPGEFGESCFSNSDTIKQECWTLMQLMEDWATASFNYNDWEFYPNQGNWDISTNTGNPSPTAVFTGIPELNNFDIHLFPGIRCVDPICGGPVVEFDLKMEALTSVNSPQLFFEIYYNSTWFTKAVFDNINTDGWEHYRYELGEVPGEFFRLRFRVAGSTSSVINTWMLDNILVDYFCFPPDSLRYFLSDSLVTLYWNKPCPVPDTLQGGIYQFGYSVFRTDSTGLPPYVKLNKNMIHDTFYIDTLPKSMLKGEFRYFIEVNNLWVCSDTSSSILVSPSIGMNEPENITVRIFPNPASEQLQIQSESALESITLWSASGVVQYHLQNMRHQKITIPVDNLSEGIYCIGILTHSGYVVRKVIVMRQ